MEAQHKDEGRIHGLTASVVIPEEGGGSGPPMEATISTSTPALAVLGMVIAGVMLTGGFLRQQGAELALVEAGSRLAAAG